MKNYDPKMAARVWDRVQQTGHPGAPATDAAAILNLIEEEWLDAVTYQRLSRKLPPPQAAAARQLSQQELAHADCLKGIYALITGRKPIVPTPAFKEESSEITLRKCYGREMRCLAQYESRQEDPQYGHIFRRLARQEQEHCHKILELLGALAK